jgi:uncharacterized protein
MIKQFFYTLLILVITASQLQAQDTTYVGNWKGQLDVGGAFLTLVLHLEKTQEWKATWDVVEQKANNIPASEIIIIDKTIEIKIASMAASFKGELDLGSQRLKGNWNQGGASLPLILEKVNSNSALKETIAKIKTQTPIAPFSYNSIDTIYKGKNTSLSYGATLTYPKKGKNFKAVILITGSGPQDRDETILEHKMFAVLADHFTKNGIAVLRIDDRGVGATSGNFETSNSRDFADDVNEHIAFLKTIPFINKKEIGLCGHSEGGLIAPLVAAENKDVAFIVSMAGPGMPIDELMILQNKMVLQSQNINKDAIDSYLPLYKNLLRIITTAEDSATAYTQSNKIISEWMANTNKDWVAETTGIINETAKVAYTNQIPVLAINGVKDIQVPATENLDGFKMALTKAGNANFTIKKFDKHNHLFQQCKTCDVSEYGTLDETIDPRVLAYITKWLKGL